MGHMNNYTPNYQDCPIDGMDIATFERLYVINLIRLFILGLIHGGRD
jgi:hypothetical protein